MSIESSLQEGTMFAYTDTGAKRVCQIWQTLSRRSILMFHDQITEEFYGILLS